MLVRCRGGAAGEAEAGLLPCDWTSGAGPASAGSGLGFGPWPVFQHRAKAAASCLHRRLPDLDCSRSAALFMHGAPQVACLPLVALDARDQIGDEASFGFLDRDPVIVLDHEQRMDVEAFEGVTRDLATR